MKKDKRPEWAKQAGISVEKLKEYTRKNGGELPYQSFDPYDTGDIILPNGKKCHIGPHNMILIRQLQKLPALTKIQLMDITDLELASILRSRKGAAKKRVIELLKKKWHWRETGDLVEITPGIVDCMPDGLSATLENVRNNKVKKDALEAIVDWFERSNTEVFIKET